MDLVHNSIEKLQNYIEANSNAGYDIYDGLKITDNKFLLNNYFTNTAITQLFKKSPLNLRKLISIQKTQMPKGMGIILNAYCNLIKSSRSEEKKNELFKKAEFCKTWLLENSLKNYHGACWNFGFNYKWMFDKPTIVITAIIAKGLYNYYSLTGCNETKQVLISIKDFILKDLHRTETKYGICFSYTPIKPDCCYNASMLAAETLARIYSITKQNELLDIIFKMVDFTLYHQMEVGMWYYNIDFETGTEKTQVDFHQGYILESLYEIIILTEFSDDKYRNALIVGSEFYFNKQFKQNGRSLWRIPKQFPTDAHFQAQGIITFSRIKELNKDYLPFAYQIAEWTIRNMQDDSGYFYYQVHRLYKNKISYMRWCNAWMFLALSYLLKNSED